MIGRQLHQYLIIEQIGEGGMGVVWKARDVRLDREVALKVLPSDQLPDSDRRERFRREARAASALNHPNIVTIYEIDVDQGVDFIAMEYIRGRTLAAALKVGQLPLDDVLHIARQTADALARAHAANIVHRDLKPGNIMLTEDGQVKVLDFGLAKVQPATPADDRVTMADLTVAGTTVGTLAYMSPEQALGESVDARSDVFSFGLVLYEMLSGIRPFTGATKSETLYKLHFADPLPLTTFRPEVPPELAAIVARTLAKKCQDRYASMVEVRDALRRFAGASAVASSIAATALIAPRRGEARLSRAAIAAVAVALLVVLGVVGWVIANRGSPALDAPPDSRVDETTGTPYELAMRAAALLERQDREGNADRAIAVLEAALAQDPNLAVAYAYLSDAFRRKHRESPDAQWQKQAAESARRALELGPDLAVAHVAQGFVNLDEGRGDDAERHFRRAVELDPLSPHPHLGLALRHAAAGRDDGAQDAFRRAIAVKGRDWRPEGELALFHYRRGRYDEAVAAWESARQLAPDNVLTLRNLGAAYHQLGRYDDAAAVLQRALEISASAPVYTNLGTTRFFQGRYADAVAAFERAVELGASNYLFWGNLGDAYRWAPGRRHESLAAYARAIDLVREQLAGTPDDVDLRTRLALYLAKRGDREPALQEITLVEARTDLQPQALMRLAVIHEIGGDRASALLVLERALTAGYPVREIGNEPELVGLRADARFQRLVGRIQQPQR